MRSQFPKATIFSTEVQLISSTNVAQQFQLHIALPENYATSGKTYPVIYMLDPNSLFGMMTQIYRYLQFGGNVPDVIIVGIGYPVENSFEMLLLRNRDYTPTIQDEASYEWLKRAAAGLGASPDFDYKGSGGAANFLNFIRRELFPFIEENYRVAPEDRTIFGFSHGGLFGLYTLFHQPNTFHRYIIGSPSIEWDDYIIGTHEENYARKNESLAAKVFMSVGSLEENNMQHLANTIHNRGYKDLELNVHVFKGETHMTVVPLAISKGLRELFV